MSERICFLAVLIFSIIPFGYNPNDLSSANYSLNISPTATPSPSPTQELDEISLNKKVICPQCPPGSRPQPGSECDGYDMTVTVSVIEPKNLQLKYDYIVSGGRIIGEGAKVIWDLNGAQPGTYKIKVDIEDELTKQRRTETKKITVLGDFCLGDCVCPTLSVEPPAKMTKAGETMTFIANVSGGSGEEITYNWKVSGREIIEGQGTPVVKVATNSKMTGKTIKAIVEIGGVCEECLKTESADAMVAKTKSRKRKD